MNMIQVNSDFVKDNLIRLFFYFMKTYLFEIFIKNFILEHFSSILYGTYEMIEQ